VNRYRHKDGDERIWITPAEMEDLMSAELLKAGLMPALEDPVVDLEAFVERHLKVQFDPYALLDPSVFGETEFRIGAPLKVSINKDLTGHPAKRKAGASQDAPALDGFLVCIVA
jgi:hypothetical protein